MPQLLAPLDEALDLLLAFSRTTDATQMRHLKQRIGDTRSGLLDTKAQIRSLHEENEALQARLNQRKTEEPDWSSGVGWLGVDGPYCLACWEESGSMTLMDPSRGGSTGRGTRTHACSDCRYRATVQ